MAVEVEIDVEVLKSEIKKTFASVSEQPQTDFIFPTGRAWAEDLGYPAEVRLIVSVTSGSAAWIRSRSCSHMRCCQSGSRWM
jgi:hypothetical protein